MTESNPAQSESARLRVEESERKLAQSQRLAHLGYWEYDIDAGRVAWSDEVCRIMGVPLQSVLTMAEFRLMIHPEDRSIHVEAWAKALQGLGTFDAEYRVLRPDGEVRFVHSIDEVIRDESGRPLRAFGVLQDVTEARCTLEMLKQSERRLAEAQQVAHLGSWERDLRTNQVTWSNELYRLFGLEPDEIGLSYERFLDFVVPQDVDRIRALVDEAIRKRGQLNFDYRITRADGSVRVLHEQGTVILNHVGEPTRLVGTAQDITERKRAEEALHQSEDRIRLIIDAIPVMAWSVQTGGLVDFLNQRWTDYTGLSLEQYLEEPTRPIHPEDIPQVIEKWRAQMAAGEGYEDEMRLRRADGQYRWFLVRTEPLRNEQGEIVRWYGVSTDIDDRKRAEQAVKESQHLLHKVLTTLPVGVLVTDRAANVILANPAAKSIWGDVIVSGRERWAQSKGYWHDSGKRIGPKGWASARALFDGQTSLNELIDIETFDGQKKTIQNSAAPIRNAEGLIVGAVIVNDDVTERVLAQKAVRESADRLQHLSRRLLKVQEDERQHLARELHDEFGQLLATITLHLHAARGLAGNAARPQLDECATLLMQAGEQIRSLALELRPTMLDTLGLEAALRWLADQHQQRIGIEVRVVGHLTGAPLPPDLSIACFRVVQEALTNVVRHASARHVWIELSQSDRLLELVVRDDGVGFDVAPTQEQAARRGRLGLLGMSERVHLLGGILEVASEPGRGTRIRAAFPLSDASEERADPEE